MKIIAATDNAGKLREFERILAPLGVQVASRRSVGLTDPVAETGTTFRENAYLKAKAVFDATGLPALADDSGLCVDALDGAPGVYSARYASLDGSDADDEENNEKLLRELADQDDRSARYVCALCFIGADGSAHYIEETCEGRIARQRQGSGGFGYDPLFLFGGKSFGETLPEEKDAVSHRGKALRALAEKIGEWV